MLCDICKKNQATGRVTVIKNGAREVKNICRQCSQNSSGLGGFNRGGQSSAYGGGGLNDIFGGLLGDLFGQSEGLGAQDLNLPGWSRQRPSEERIDFNDYLSDEASHVLGGAAKFAQESQNAVIDTEHLLYSLLQTETRSEEHTSELQSQSNL